MQETPTKENNPYSPENLEKLGFEELQNTFKITSELAKTTFKRVENGFANANGDGIYIKEGAGGWKISEISNTLKDSHRLVATGDNKILQTGSTDKEELMKAIREMLEATGNRIIE
ncbi:MAG: hypothetical protein PHT51_05255 [Patescibacteria group bacterium]|nr:hypothetical protein [Patescibacteria group bacterium]MDD4611352.1 hypothetical protein [Patescibacteria group bacterium]